LQTRHQALTRTSTHCAPCGVWRVALMGAWMRLTTPLRRALFAERARALPPGCHATSMQHCALPTCALATCEAHARALAGVDRCDRHAAHASVPRMHCSAPWPLTALATPRRRAPGAIPARSHAGTTAHVTPTSATAPTGEAATAATAAAETCCMHTAQPAQGCQGARDTGHARGRPRLHGQQAHQRCALLADCNGNAHLFDQPVTFRKSKWQPQRRSHCSSSSDPLLPSPSILMACAAPMPVATAWALG
jgi:hypothetical protein